MTDAIVPLIKFAVDLQPNDLPQSVVRAVQNCVFDTLGVAVAGSQAPGVPPVVSQIMEWGGRGEAPVFLADRRVPAPYAAMANSLMAHAFDYDDTHERGIMHAYSIILPTALAAAELNKNVNGLDLLSAVAVGVEISCRLALCFTNYDRGFHVTSTCGVFGATAAAGRMLGLNRNEMHNAFGIAYSLCSGNLQAVPDASLTKRLQAGFAARAGVEAALFAKRGLTGAKDILQGKYGFLRVYLAEEFDIASLNSDLGQRYEVEAVSLKPYPCCRTTHASIDAVLEFVRATEFEPSEVQAISVEMPAQAVSTVGRKFVPGESPQVNAQFSIGYPIAAALLHGKVGLRQFELDAVLDPRIRPIADLVQVVATEEPYEFGPQTITIKLKNGSVFKRTVTTLKGHPGNPMSRDEQIAKVQECFAVAGMRPTSVEGLLTWCDELPTNSVPLASLASVLGLKART